MVISPTLDFSRAISSSRSSRSRSFRAVEKRLGPFPSMPEGAPTSALGERSGAPSGLRPSSFVMCNTPVEVQFTSAGCLNYPCRTPEELQAALVEFATRYNETWLVARHGYRTPAQMRADQCRLDPNTTADLKLAA